MNPIKSLMGRRQFLITTGAASAAALAAKKLTGIAPGAQMSSNQAQAASKKAANQFPSLLSPFRIRNVVLKNRIMHTTSPPHSLQGPENYPAEAYRNHYSNMAKNAAIVSVSMSYGSYPKTYMDGPMAGPSHYSDDIWQDIPPVENYVRRMIDDIHMEGALVSGTSHGSTSSSSAAPQGGGQMPEGGMQGGMQGGPGGGSSKTTEELIADAKEAEEMGIDVISVNGNDVEQAQAIRNATNLVLIAKLSVGGGISDTSKGGNKKWRWDYEGSEYDWVFSQKVPGTDNTHCPTKDEIEEAIEAARKLEGTADILWIRDCRNEHPNSFIQNKEKPFNLYYAEAIKKAGIDMIVCPSAGFHDVYQNEKFIANGQADMVGMTTPFFADPEYVKKALEGRADEINTCIQCHSCHGISRSLGPWYDTCTVNPKWATPDYKLKNIPAPTTQKKVAVIGGGPAGMKAALTAKDRGHDVTLYEKEDKLGGLIKFSDYSEWRWNHKELKDGLIHLVEKAGIKVKLNTTATPKMIEKAGYDTVLVANGSEVIKTKMKGDNVLDIMEAYTNKEKVKGDVVLIGAGRIGTECAIGIAKDGHKITQISTGEDLIEQELIGSHNMMNQILILQDHPNYDCVLNAMPKSIDSGKVVYTDSDGKQKSIKADTVIVFSGLKPRMDEAESFFKSATQVLTMGNCTGKNHTIQRAIRTAYFAASQV
jgi:2,4-dienoyl-CoA reductase-like NADH-dependent reductase (Old Yellow Enzyme family)/thioredoxin reductase